MAPCTLHWCPTRLRALLLPLYTHILAKGRSSMPAVSVRLCSVYPISVRSYPLNLFSLRSCPLQYFRSEIVYFAHNLEEPMDNLLSFSPYITKLTALMQVLLFNIRRMWLFLSTETTQVLVESLVILKLNYNMTQTSLPLCTI